MGSKSFNQNQPRVDHQGTDNLTYQTPCVNAQGQINHIGGCATCLGARMLNQIRHRPLIQGVKSQPADNSHLPDERAFLLREGAHEKQYRNENSMRRM
jgi:hypothetical protein